MKKDLSSNDKKLIHEQSVKFLRRIAFERVNDTNLMDLLSYNETSLWWYLDLSIYYKLKKSFDPNYKNLDKENIIWSNIISYFGVIFYLIKTIVRYFHGILKSERHENDNSVILIPSSSLSWRKSNATTNKKKDVMVGDVLDGLKSEEFNVIACDISEEISGFGLTKLNEKISEEVVWKPIEYYLNFQVLINVFSAWVVYIRKWRKFKNNKEFLRLFDFQNSNLYSDLSVIFKRFFYCNSFNILMQIELLKNAIGYENVDVTLTYCDLCTFGLSTIIAGNEKSIPTISLQTSLMNPNGREYIYSYEEISKFPIPTKTALNGEYYKDLLIKESSYPKDNLTVIGQPRYDFLFKEHYSKENFCIENGIDCNKKLILVTTQPFGFELHKSINDKFITAILGLEKCLDEMLVIIKPHPRETSDYYRGLIDDNSNFHILNEKFDTYEAINACDLLITFSSTTAIEAMIMKKPIIILNLTNEEITPYTEYGAAILVKDEKYLFPTIKLAMYDNETREKLFTGQKNFLNYFLYLQDGFATNRFINLIRNILEN